MSSRAALAVALAVAALGCGQTRPEGNAIVVAMANAPVNLDPRVAADEASQKAHQLLYDTLVRIDDDLRIVPQLAEVDQPNATTYVAHLRKGVLFHDGSELTADDVVYTFRSFLDPAFRGRSGAYRQLLASVEALHRFYTRDQQTVVGSWMTREDRELAIADNVEYVAKVIDRVEARSPATTAC